MCCTDKPLTNSTASERALFPNAYHLVMQRLSCSNQSGVEACTAALSTCAVKQCECRPQASVLLQLQFCHAVRLCLFGAAVLCWAAAGASTHTHIRHHAYSVLLLFGVGKSFETGMQHLSAMVYGSWALGQLAPSPDASAKLPPEHVLSILIWTYTRPSIVSCWYCSVLARRLGSTVSSCCLPCMMSGSQPSGKHVICSCCQYGKACHVQPCVHCVLHLASRGVVQTNRKIMEPGVCEVNLEQKLA